MAVAELPMYDLPELRSATDSWWAGIAHALRREGVKDVPDRLNREQSTETPWQPDLFLSQVCGSCIVGARRECLAYIATPCYTAPGCNGHLYRSVLVVPATCSAQTIEDLRGLRCAINGYASHSGCNVLRATLAPLARSGRFFCSVAVSGGHAASLALIAGGQADVAAIDCITHALLSRYRPHLLQGIRIIAQTVAAPVGPYVTGIGASADFIARMRGGLAQAMYEPDLVSVRADLLIGGIDILPVEDYAQIARIEVDAMRLSYRDFDPKPAA